MVMDKIVRDLFMIYNKLIYVHIKIKLFKIINALRNIFNLAVYKLIVFYRFLYVSLPSHADSIPLEPNF